MSESQDASHEPAISVFTAQAGPSCKTGSATRPGETGWHVRSRFERQLIGASDLTVLEFSAGAERGWGCLVGDSFVIPARLRRAAAAAPMWARFFGTTEWFDFGSLGGQPAPGGRHVGQPWAGGLPEEDIFTLWARVLDGELTVDAAVGSAARLETVADSALTEAGIISKHLALHGRTREGALLGQVAVAAADVLGASEFARAQLAAEFLEAARLRLTDVPSPKLLRAARAAGDAALAWARARDQSVLVEMLTFRLGTLHLDPYTSDRDGDTYWLQQRHGCAAEWRTSGCPRQARPRRSCGPSCRCRSRRCALPRTISGRRSRHAPASTGAWRSRRSCSRWCSSACSART